MCVREAKTIIGKAPRFGIHTLGWTLYYQHVMPPVKWARLWEEYQLEKLISFFTIRSHEEGNYDFPQNRTSWQHRLDSTQWRRKPKTNKLVGVKMLAKLLRSWASDRGAYRRHALCGNFVTIATHMRIQNICPCHGDRRVSGVCAPRPYSFPLWVLNSRNLIVFFAEVLNSWNSKLFWLQECSSVVSVKKAVLLLPMSSDIAMSSVIAEQCYMSRVIAPTDWLPKMIPLCTSTLFLTPCFVQRLLFQLVAGVFLFCQRGTPCSRTAPINWGNQ